MSVSDVKGVERLSEIMSKNKLKIAFIADDIKTLNKFGIHHNTTFGLMLAAQEILMKKESKGILLFATSDNLKVKNGKVVGTFYEVVVKKKLGKHLKVISTKEYDLSSIDVIFARKDPPVDQKYLAFIQMLALANKHSSKNKKPFIVNKPEGVLKANEKLYAYNLPDLLLPSLITSNEKEINAFLIKYKEIVIKPLFYKGGIGIYHLKSKDKKSLSVIRKALKDYSVLLVQKYLPIVKKGDKRILLLNGKILGGIYRIPQRGEFRAHLSRGAVPKRLKLSKRDLKICNRLKPYLIRDGLYFTGIDIIGNYLIEVNVTCPANLLEAGKLHKKDFAKEIVNWTIKQAS